MADTVVRGNTITKDAFYRDVAGDVADATDPHVSIIDPTGQTLVSNDTPTHVSTGYYTFDWPVASNAMLGGYTIRWSGVIDGDPVTDDDVFTVLAATSSSSSADGGETCSPWAFADDVPAPCNDYDFDQDLLDENLQAATDVLYNLTGRRWAGECIDVIRPESACACKRPTEWGCSRLPTIKLPGTPAYNVVVRLDGVQYHESDGLFRVDNDRELVRIDGDGWPCCQRMDLPTSEEGTFEISYSFGLGPPIGGVRAAAMYGCQLALAFDPAAISDGRCRLPKRVTSITRQGTTVALLDPMSFIKDGLTGLSDIDTWINSVRVGDSRRRSTVLIPGKHRSARRTT